jgi:single-strand DNA-binding protein
MTDTFVTLHGWLGTDVSVRQAGDAQVAGFRLACTPRRFNRRANAWGDGPTQWYAVDAWRALGENCRDSLRRGDPVVVHGRLEVRVWTNSAGVEVTSLVVEAASVGHDLNRGTSRFARTPRAVSPQGEGEPAHDETPRESAA